MYATYANTDIPKYLDSEGGELLEEGRTHFDRLGLQDRYIVPQGERTVLFLWAGDRIVDTMHVLLSQKGYKVSKAGMTLEIQNCGPEELFEELQHIVNSDPPKPPQLAESVENKITDKHDRYLSDDLLCANYASKRLDVEGAIIEAENIIKTQ
jgi:ATP-dependent Lhr-like helicase